MKSITRKIKSLKKTKRKSVKTKRKSIKMRKRNDGMVEEESKTKERVEISLPASETETDILSRIRTKFFKEKDVVEIPYKNELNNDVKNVYHSIIFSYIKDYFVYYISEFAHKKKNIYKLILDGGVCVQFHSDGKRTTSDLDYKLYPVEERFDNIDNQINYINELFKYLEEKITNEKIKIKMKQKFVITPEIHGDKILLSYKEFLDSCTFSIVKDDNKSIIDKSKVIKFFLKCIHTTSGNEYKLHVIDFKLYDKKNQTLLKIYDDSLQIPPNIKVEGISDDFDIIILSKEFLLFQLKTYIRECRNLFEKVIKIEEEYKKEEKKEETRENEVAKLIKTSYNNNKDEFKEGQKESIEYKKIIDSIIKRKKLFFANLNSHDSKIISKVKTGSKIPLYESIEYICCDKAVDQYNALIESS